MMQCVAMSGGFGGSEGAWCQDFVGASALDEQLSPKNPDAMR